MGCWCRGKRIGKGATYRQRGVSAFLPIVLVIVLDFPFGVASIWRTGAKLGI
jgi:hypothetical protein